MRNRGPLAGWVPAAYALALATAAEAGETVTYGYDSLGRLTNVSRSGAVNNGVTASYSYDSADNRTGVAVGVPAAAAPPPPPPVFSVSGSSADEGSNLMFTILKSGSTTQTLSVGYATSNGSGAADSDYHRVSGTATFLPGQTSATVAVGTIADGLAEPAETVIMTLSGPTGGATLAPQGNPATGTINSSSAQPPPPAPTGNSPPVANPDSASFVIWQGGMIDVLSNDTDPNGNLPLVLKSVSGSSYASVSGSSVRWSATGRNGVYTLTYVVADSQGATATGTLTVTVGVQ